MAGFQIAQDVARKFDLIREYPYLYATQGLTHVPVVDGLLLVGNVSIDAFRRQPSEHNPCFERVQKAGDGDEHG